MGEHEARALEEAGPGSPAAQAAAAARGGGAVAHRGEGGRRAHETAEREQWEGTEHLVRVRVRVGLWVRLG